MAKIHWSLVKPGGFAQKMNGFESSISCGPVCNGARDGNAGSRGLCGSNAVLYGRRAIETVSPSFTGSAASCRTFDVTVFMLPSWSSVPQRPQFEYLSIQSYSVSTVIVL